MAATRQADPLRSGGQRQRGHVLETTATGSRQVTSELVSSQRRGELGLDEERPALAIVDPGAWKPAALSLLFRDARLPRNTLLLDEKGPSRLDLCPSNLGHESSQKPRILVEGNGERMCQPILGLGVLIEHVAHSSAAFSSHRSSRRVRA